ncbi:hypothetical protein NB069_01900 [Leclercia adecarboxylata]|uniref:hypothetical protein n=1 Tax=Leclercia adecarboxylata TaxID=83655 RepID=UPI00202A5D5F|nr:hypothetical protein [Leclercia adecarboxylata]URN99667.1 hypothetical protein NB069_01900 [Leclercia adecarboxylata]
MKELNAFELEAVSGAGWLQDSLASLGSNIGTSVWSMGSDIISKIELPIVGNVNLVSLAPDLGTQLGKMVGLTVGFTIETALAGVPLVGGLLNRMLGN